MSHEVGQHSSEQNSIALNNASSPPLLPCKQCKALKIERDALLEACKAAQLMLLQTNWNGDPRMNIVSAAISLAEKEG